MICAKSSKIRALVAIEESKVEHMKEVTDFRNKLATMEQKEEDLRSNHAEFDGKV